MQPLSVKYEAPTPERLVALLVKRLRQHALWDVLLLLAPPLIVAADCFGYLYGRTWITPATLAFAAFIVASLTLTAVIYGYRSAPCSARLAARLIDQRTEAADRFITLTTLEPGSCAPSLLGRLRAEASRFLHRVRLKHDFRYKIKRSFYRSLLASIAFAALFHLTLPIVETRNVSRPVPDRLREIAANMARRPALSGLGRQLQELAKKIEDPQTAEQEKRTAVQEMQEKIQQEQKNEKQKDNQDLLSQAAGALKGAEQQLGTGQEQEKNQEGGNGGIQSNLPREGQGEGKPDSGGGGESQGGEKAQLSKNTQDGKTSQAELKEQGKESRQQQSGDGKGREPDPGKAEREKTQDPSSKSQNNREDRGGRSKGSEDIPQGAPPAERFKQPGEQGSEGLKGARYVTVQLPEEVAADSKSASAGGKDSKGNRVGAKLPVSNAPLPAHVADSPTEKQLLPLEYRGIIR